MSVRYRTVGIVVMYPNAIRVDKRRDGKSALGWFALDRSPLAFLRADERRLLCDTAMARLLPEQVPLCEVLTRLDRGAK